MTFDYSQEPVSDADFKQIALDALSGLSYVLNQDEWDSVDELLSNVEIAVRAINRIKGV